VPIEGFMGALQVECLPERSKRCCCARRVRAGGRVVSALSVRCIRSWRPFGWGLPGSMHSGRRPRRTHQAESCESRPRVLVAKGTPLSVRMRLGKPNSLNKRVNTGLASATRVEERA